MAENSELVWKALADPTRRRLMDLLRQRAHTTGELCAHFESDLSRFAVMKHLRVLEQAGLAVVRPKGKERWHYLNAVPLQRVADRWITAYEAHWASSLLHLKQDVEQPEPRAVEKEQRPMETIKIEQEMLIEAEPWRVFDALTTGVDAWWSNGKFKPDSTFHMEPHVGGKFSEYLGDAGEGTLFATVTLLKRDERLVMSGPMGIDRAVIGVVSFDLEPKGEATLVKLAHQMIGDIDEATRASYTQGWSILRQNLKTFVETGSGYRTKG